MMQHAIDCLETCIYHSQRSVKEYQDQIKQSLEAIEFAERRIDEIRERIELTEEIISQCDTAIQILQDREN